MENKYRDGKIYMIESASTALRYYGSTCQSLSRRMADHRATSRLEKRPGLTSLKVLEHPDARIILVEAFPCNNKNELTARESYYIRNNVCVNKMMKCMGRSGADHKYYINHREARIAASIAYSRANKDKVNAQRRVLRLRKMLENATEALAAINLD